MIKNIYIQTKTFHFKHTLFMYEHIPDIQLNPLFHTYTKIDNSKANLCDNLSAMKDIQCRKGL